MSVRRAFLPPTCLSLTVALLTIADRDIRTRRFVLVEDDRTISISGAPPPDTEGLIIVDGQGLTLMPGLIDMHTHIFDRTDLFNYLTRGVTTVRNMMGMPMHLQWHQLPGGVSCEASQPGRACLQMM